MSKENDESTSNDLGGGIFASTLVICVMLWMWLFSGDPSLNDAIIHYLMNQ